jgi:glutathione S-transferase
MTSKYTIYGGELSYFTRKLEAAMIFYSTDFDFLAKTPENRNDVEYRSGTHQVPVLQTPEDWMIGDTTPLMTMLDARFPARRMFPEGSPGVLVHVLEEYFDEWIARTMVHYRWHYEESAHFASMKMSDGDPDAAATVLSWGPRACRATGTESERQQRAAEDEYVRILEAAETQLNSTPYLLGDRPTAVDCIVLGGLRAHTLMDPDPTRVASQYKTVVEWTRNRADTWDGRGALASIDAPTPFAEFVLAEMRDTYKPFLLANRDANAAGAKAFHARIYGEDVSYLTRPYPPFSASLVTDRIRNTLDAAEASRVSAWLTEQQLADCFA